MRRIQSLTECRTTSKIRRWLVGGLALLLAAPTLALPVLSANDDEFGELKSTDRQVAQIVSRIMQNDHLSARPLNDDMSQRAIGLYLDSLDPMKLYFYQADIDRFNLKRDTLDDDLMEGNLDFAVNVFKVYLDRVDERVQTVNDLLAGDFDFDLNEEMIIDPDAATYPTNPEEARDLWRKRLKYNLLVLKTEETEGAEAIERLTKRYNSFAKRMHQFDAQDVVEMFITSVTSAFDPHTTYMSKRSYENFLIQMRLNLEGIGASLQSVDGMTVIKRVVPGGAADKDGRIKVEDKITAVGQGESGEMVDVADMKLDDVVDMIRGKAGTTVRLSVMSNATNEVETIAIVRERIELKDSEASGEVFEQGVKEDGTPFRLGVIALPSFYRDTDAARIGRDNFRSTTRDVERILNEFKEDKVDAVVLDLRHNGGGFLEEAINCTGLFIDYGPVVQVKDSTGNVRPLYDERRGTAWDGPIVVVTDRLSASASEILAGAIQDYGRGIVVGDTATHGKGTVQSLINLGGVLFRVPNPPKTLGALKITMQQFYRPSGDSTQKRGVMADVVLPSIYDYMDIGEAKLDFAVDFDKVREARFDKLSMVGPAMLNRIREQSTGRVQMNEEFQELNRDIERYREQKEQTTISLNEEKFFARRAELDAEKRDEEALMDAATDDNKIERDFYLDEVLSITVDYLLELAKDDVARIDR